ncbi:hypothetical protein PGIGA_G00054710, partial [Pangasianodon gigas]|nr:hypothetical protein [Pangasianodon gigas]
MFVWALGNLFSPFVDNGFHSGLLSPRALEIALCAFTVLYILITFLFISYGISFDHNIVYCMLRPFS